MEFSKSVLVLGSGGREHCIAWKLSQSSLLSPSATIYIAPGNGATALPVPPSSSHGPSIPIVNVPLSLSPSAFPSLISFAQKHHVGLVVIGPEDPLAAGVTDAFADAGIATFGPSAAAAQLEASKAYCKDFMTRHRIPTAAHHSFTSLDAAIVYLHSLPPSARLVVKASGLAAGKGVLMCPQLSDAVAAVTAMLGDEARFGEAGKSVVIEEWLEGEEVSVMAFCDGHTVRLLPPAQDHKRIFEFDRGLNTGGMGAFAPSPTVTPQLQDVIVSTILQPTIDGCRADGHPFIGVLFAGLMLTKEGPKTLEFNVRFGDPETQVQLPLLDSDLLVAMLACIEGRLGSIELEWKTNTVAACVVAVSAGYPEAYRKGKVITGVDSIHHTEANPVTVFQAGTEFRKEDRTLVTNGGRVLAVTAVASSLTSAFSFVYSNLELISFDGMFYRKDIGRAWHRPQSSQPLRLAVLGSTNGTDLPPVLQAIEDGRLQARVEVVISSRSSAGLLDKAKHNHIPAITVVSKGKTREEFDREVLAILQAYNVDVVLMIGFMRIVSHLLIDAFHNRILNVHPSLLPLHAGGMDSDVHAAVLAAGEKETGCTIHIIDDGPVDSGPILVQKRCRVEADDTPDTLKRRVQQLEGEAFIEAIAMFQDDQQLLTSLTQGHPVERQGVVTLYRANALSAVKAERLRSQLNEALKSSGEEAQITGVDTEFSFYIDLHPGSTWTSIGEEKRKTLTWLLGETFEPENLSRSSFLAAKQKAGATVVEVGPRLSFTSAWSTNACSICQHSLIKVDRLERFRRFAFTSSSPLSSSVLALISSHLYDRMTEQVLTAPLTTFHSLQQPDAWYSVPLLNKGLSALQRVNAELGLALDPFDQQFILDLFTNQLKRNPTSVELFDLAQSNSEHSRHWFFRGQLCVDGEVKDHTLMDVVRQTLQAHPDNSIIAFADNSSAILGHSTCVIQPSSATTSSPFSLAPKRRHLLLTAETHNFPSGVAPFPGAETGTGGRIRDTVATGTGSLFSAGVAAYCVGQLHLPHYPLPWEDADWSYPSNLASPLKIAVEASNGASDYGNKFGEPVVAGFSRSFGLRTPAGERREWIKPIMFSAGLGFIDEPHRVKGKPAKGMVAVKIGGPAYRIGMGGSAASSMVQGDNKEALDFNAVQRGDAEMEQKVNRVIRACVDLGEANPIVSVHDQGAGGNCNVLKELLEPAGGRIDIRKVAVGDETMSVLEIWGAEYQENWGLLIHQRDQASFDDICRREKAPVCYVGEVTGDGVVVVYDSRDQSTPVELDLETVLGNIPQKRFNLNRQPIQRSPLLLPADLTVSQALDRLLRLVSVGSKRYLTNKVDRSVTGLVAQQQCVGPLQLPLADVAVIATSHFDIVGVATAVGEQPIKGLIHPANMARLTVGEALTNIVWAQLTAITDLKCSANWMWAAKIEGEGAQLYDAAIAMRDCMIDVGIAVDGGKDSLSMAARAHAETVKAPGALVVSLYGPCPDITRTITPDIKACGASTLIHVDLSGRLRSLSPRLGGSSLATVYKQLGDVTPNMDSTAEFRRGWETVQRLVKEQRILAGHDISDGGLLVTLLEMAFAGNCGLEVNVVGQGSVMEHMFGEELGVVVEVTDGEVEAVQAILSEAELHWAVLGRSRMMADVWVGFNGVQVLKQSMAQLRDAWEATSFELEKLQANPDCVASEQRTLRTRSAPPVSLSFTVEDTDEALMSGARTDKPKVAVVREEGSNGDREMAAAFFAAGFDVWDVTMTDLLDGRVHLNCGSSDDGRPFRGVAFVGGFSYADVMDSAKGWAGAILKVPSLRAQFAHFVQRPDTFSLGVCNGCQLMALLGWVPFDAAEVDHDNPPARFIHNDSGRYESRWTTVKIQPSPSIFLQGMEGSVLGIWVSHGEGRAYFKDGEKTLKEVEEKGLAPIRFVDDLGEATTLYPFNANGSPNGIAALCSRDGRHLALMPHPERCHRSWACPWLPSPHSRSSWSSQYRETAQHSSPWMRLFQNARRWCEAQATTLLYGANIEQRWYEHQIRQQLSCTLNDTHLSAAPASKKVGKVRDTYVADDVMVLITTDRISAFDRLIACIPCKGRVLNQVAAFWFSQTAHIVPNHVLSVPHPNVTIARLCKPFAVEVVVRAFLTGSTSTSLWTHYSQGGRDYCGNVLKDGMRKHERLPHSIVTPTTKSDEHDRPISPADIVSEQLMTQEQWDEVSSKALELFAYGQQVALKHGLLLVDTKYEFGVDSEGVLRLIDEVHTPDSSRYWIAQSYEQLHREGKEPEMIDKEFLRLWYTQHSDPYSDATLPAAPQALVVELSRRYILLYEMITGGKFDFPKVGSEQAATAEAIERVVTRELERLRAAKQPPPAGGGAEEHK